MSNALSSIKPHPDVTLNRYMHNVYLWMIAGLIITTLSGYGASFYMSNLALDIVLGLESKKTAINILYIAALSQFCVVVFLSFMIKKIKPFIAKLSFILYATLTGVSFAIVLFAYQSVDIITIFATTTFSFIGLSAYGLFTKRSLEFLGTFSIMGLFGLMGFILISFIFPSIHSNTNQLISAVVGIIVFSGLTAYDTKRIKTLPQMMGISVESATIYGALQLYLDYINLFFSLLRLFRR
jgi:FtsH-binding integral membrane protein